VTSLDPKGLQAAHAEYHKTLGGLADGHPMENAIAAYLSASTTPSGEVEGLVERAAQKAFRAAQTEYRASHDHFPLKRTWETTDEKVRSGWRDIASAAISEASAALASMKREVERLTQALERIADQPEQYDDGKLRYSVGYAFYLAQNCASQALGRD
jgi:hypothetical protein